MKIQFLIWKRGLWIIIFSRWFYLSYDPNYQPLFSERNGYRKIYRLFGFVFKTEKREI